MRMRSRTPARPAAAGLLLSETSDDAGRDRASSLGASAGRRGLALAAGFWVVIGVLLGARVALFDEIAASRMASFVGTQMASISSLLVN